MLTTGHFPNMVNQMVALAEEAGSNWISFVAIPSQIITIREIEMVIETLLSLIEPVQPPLFR